MSDDHHILFAITKNNSQNPTNWKKRSIGATGEYGKRAVFTRLGSFRNRYLRVLCSSPRRCDILGAVAAIEPTEG